MIMIASFLIVSLLQAFKIIKNKMFKQIIHPGWLAQLELRNFLAATKYLNAILQEHKVVNELVNFEMNKLAHFSQISFSSSVPEFSLWQCCTLLSMPNELTS